MAQKIDFLRGCTWALVSFFMIACGPAENSAASSTSGSTSGGQGGAGGTSDTGGHGGHGGAVETPVWAKPACTTISGTSAVTFTNDEGATLAPTPGLLSGIGYTFGLAALDTPNTLLAEHKGILLRSEDAGCTWKEIGKLEGGPFHLSAAKGGLAYAWADNYPEFYRIEPSGPQKLSTPATNIVGIGVDPKDGMHLRVGDASGAIADSIDGGNSWMKQGFFPAASIGYRIAFDPADLDHVLFGQATEGAIVSFDGGKTTQPSTGLGTGKNAFSLAVSPADRNVVWGQGKDLATGVAHIYRSTDGGASFSDVVTAAADMILVNGTLIVPHAANTNVLYFVFGTYFNQYGTDIFRYDHATGMVTKTHNAYHDVSAIVASPADPNLLYFGLTVEEGI